MLTIPRLLLRSNPGLQLANAFGVILFSKKVADEFYLFQITRAPGADHQVQSKRQPFTYPK